MASALASYGAALFHVPGLVRYGSKPAREIAENPALLDGIRAALRDWSAATAYAPNAVFIGALDPEVLFDRPRPWWRAAAGNKGATEGRFGVFLDEADTLAAIAGVDHVHNVRIAASAADDITARLHRLRARFGWDAVASFAVAADDEIAAEVRTGGAVSLQTDGRLVGCVRQGYPGDVNQAADVLLENLAAKATATIALLRALDGCPVPRMSVDYVISCGEEAVGDRYQRGGGSLGKAVAEAAGLAHAGGVDVKAFCAAPIHALITAAALVHAGVFGTVAVVGGGSLPKLGMKFLGHLATGAPILEDVLGAFATIVTGRPGVGPTVRLDAATVHRTGQASSAPALAQHLLIDPVRRLGLEFGDVDRYVTELHNPEVTEPAGAGDVPRLNYEILLAVARRVGLTPERSVDAFVRRQGVIGFAPTQGHIPAAVPYLGHALAAMQAGRMSRVLLCAKGSLFLGRLTEMSDGASLLIESARAEFPQRPESPQEVEHGTERQEGDCHRRA